ncbi:MAG: glutamate--tRNA ligase [Chloroflexota bacterium]
MADQPVRVRIAPSPTGDPHVGTAYVALFNVAFARRHGGQFVLRIEDTDQARYVAESERLIYESLNWLGIDWEEGPNKGGPFGPYRQSERQLIYQEHARILVENGGGYYCFCTPERLEQVRKEQMSRKEPPKYDGHCREISPDAARGRIAAGETAVVRLRVPTTGETGWQDLIRNDVTFQNAVLNDAVLFKTDGFPTYHLANVVDDHLMQISHVARAEEWISSTPLHLLIYRAFGWDPPLFAHLPLLRNRDKSKISKRKNPTSLKWFEAEGYLPEAMVNFLALMGWSLPDGREIFTLDDIIANFSWERVSTTGPVFDLEKLEWLNGSYIRSLPLDDLIARATPFIERADLPASSEPAYLRAIMPLVQERLKRLSETPELIDFFFIDSQDYDNGLLIPKGLDAAGALNALEATLGPLDTVASWDRDTLERAIRPLAEELGVKTGQLFMILRVAITFRTQAPPLFETMEVLGPIRTRARVRAALAQLRDLAQAETRA